MGRPREWFLVTFPALRSAWLLRVYRRPWTFLCGLVAVPLAVVLVVTYRLNVSLARQQTLHNLSVAARLAAEIVDETLAETFHVERLLAAQPVFAEAIRRRDHAQLTRRLQETLQFIPRVDVALVMTPQGEIIACSPPRPELLGRVVAEGEPFLGAQQGGWHPYLSAVYLREGPETEKVVGVVLPISEDGSVVGLLQLQHRVEQVKSWLQKIRLNPSGFLYVVDHQSQLVVYPFQVLPGRPKKVSTWPPVAQALSAEGRTLSFRDERTRQRWLTGVQPVGTTGWRVVAVQPERAALQTLSRVFWSLGMLVLILLGLVAAFLGRWVQLHALSLQLLRQNAKLLKQVQQRRTLERGK